MCRGKRRKEESAPGSIIPGFKIFTDGDGYIIKRMGCNAKYEQHAHIKTYNTAKLLLRLIKQKRMPKSEYLQESCRRLLTPKEFSRLRIKKQDSDNRQLNLLQIA